MSRHTIRDDDQYEVTVGYDDPLDTFFAQVFDVRASARADEDVYALLVGQRPQEITDVTALAVSLERWVAIIPMVIVETLRKERANRVLPTEFQRATFHMLTGDELP